MFRYLFIVLLLCAAAALASDRALAVDDASKVVAGTLRCVQSDDAIMVYAGEQPH